MGKSEPTCNQSRRPVLTTRDLKPIFGKTEIDEPCSAVQRVFLQSLLNLFRRISIVSEDKEISATAGSITNNHIIRGSKPSAVSTFTNSYSQNFSGSHCYSCRGITTASASPAITIFRCSAAATTCFMPVVICLALVKSGNPMFQIFFVALPGWFIATALYIGISKLTQKGDAA